MNKKRGKKEPHLLLVRCTDCKRAYAIALLPKEAACCPYCAFHTLAGLYAQVRGVLYE